MLMRFIYASTAALSLTPVTKDEKPDNPCRHHRLKRLKCLVKSVNEIIGTMLLTDLLPD